MTQVSINPCLPPPDPCGAAVAPLFQSGVSIRQVPLCEGPYCDCQTPGYGRARITGAGTLDRSQWLEGWIIGQLTNRAEVSCDEHPLKRRAGGWWADAFRKPAGFRTGSKLWALQWALVTNEALIAAKQYATQALAPLLAWGIASRVNVQATFVSRMVMRLTVTVTGPGVAAVSTVEGLAVPDSGWLWKEYVATPAQMAPRIGPTLGREAA